MFFGNETKTLTFKSLRKKFITFFNSFIETDDDETRICLSKCKIFYLQNRCEKNFLIKFLLILKLKKKCALSSMK